ncbi:Multiple organellar RNA editing factor 3, mitochondrial [Capsicum baccatum]|uniref:Multiple organellar RNA editing factor 3, mitochondrial n=1 Tax=Capsicum baccatum TaxID=33114 RepID=A0A2G2VRD1_CAPBA|nr:Multiple organellar RNA editing factor 3, mitochondrial [Capsicum baccatum]
MAARYLTRSLLTSLSRSYTSLSLSIPPPSFSLLRLRPLIAVAAFNLRSFTPAAVTAVRGYATRQTSSSLNDPNPNWSNRPPKETILLDGCDFEHWLVVMEKPEGDPTRDEIIDSYIKTLAQIVGSEEEARMKIYSVSTRHYYAFGALVSEELSYKLKELPKVRWVLPDSYLDVRNKDYGGEPFINGQAVPYDPKYHEEWVRNNARANERNRRNDRPRNFDRSRNFERRRENPGSNMGGGPPNMRNAPPPNMGGMQQQQPQPNMGGMQQQQQQPQPNMGGMQQQPNMGGMQQPRMGGGLQQPNMGGAPQNYGGGPPNMGGGPQQPNMGGAPQNYGGGPPNMGGGPQQPNMGGAPQNYGGGPQQPNMGGAQQNYGGGPPSNYGGAPPNNYGGGMPYQTGPGPNQNYASNPSGGNHYQNPNMPPPNQNYAPNTSGGNPHQNQNMPGRDMPSPNYQ